TRLEELDDDGEALVAHALGDGRFFQQLRIAPRSRGRGCLRRALRGRGRHRVERRRTQLTRGTRLRTEMATTYPPAVHAVVIVGAGTAGCVLASRLTEDPDVSVLLLESGKRSRKLETKIPAAFSKLFRSDVDWGDSTVPQAELDGREIVFPHGRML